MKGRKWVAMILAAALSLSSTSVWGNVAGVPQGTDAVYAAEKLANAVKPYGTPWLNSNVVGMVTKSVKPNEKNDFYIAKNYKKLIKAKLRPGYSSEGTLDEVSDTVNDRLQSLMTDASLTADYAKLVQEYYQMYLDWDSRKAASRSYFESHLRPIQQIRDIDSLTAYLESEEALVGGEELFGYGVEPDSQDPDYYMVSISSTDLSLGDAAEYEKETPYGKRTKKAVTEEATYVLKYAGYTDEEAALIIADGLAFEKELASAMMTQEDWHASNSVDRYTNPRTGEELGVLSQTMPLMDMLKAWGVGDSLRYNLYEPEWLEKMNALYVPERVGQMKNYLLFHYAMDSMTSLDETAYRESQRIGRELSGISESRDDEYYAFKATQGMLWNFVDQMYVEKYCSPEMKEDIRKIMEEVVAEYKKMLRKEDWLSAKTRNKAVAKLNAIKLCPVYPDKWEDWSNIAFATRAEGGSYQEANEAIVKAMLENERKRVNTTVDKDLWDMTCTAVNASYWPDRNRILIYAGILDGAVYNDKMSEEEKLGAIGMIIGHEISHAFDNRGSQYDEKGRVHDWWTKADRKAFRKRADKLVAYFDAVVPFKNGQHYNGTLVQGEAIADMGGLKCMLSIAGKTKNFDYDKFFSAYANLWYNVLAEETMENIYMQNSHPLNYLRVNAVLAQFEEFQNTYKLKEGDGMYLAPKDRVAVW